MVVAAHCGRFGRNPVAPVSSASLGGSMGPVRTHSGNGYDFYS
jgi:hypothetical protein